MINKEENIKSQDPGENTKQDGKRRIDPGIVVGFLISVVSIYVFATSPSYEALIAILGGIATILTFISKEKELQKWLLVGILFVVAVAGIIYVRLMTDPEEIIIAGIFYDGAKEQEGDEYVIIRNEDMRSVQLEGWTLHDNQSAHVYTFPRYEIQPGKECRIYTNEDHPETCGFNFQNGGSGVWNNIGGDMATLRDADGLVIDTSIDFIEPLEDGEAVQPTAETANSPTPTPSPPNGMGETATSGIVIMKVNSDGVVSDKEPDEYVEIRNEGDKAVQLLDWILMDENDNEFEFPEYLLEPMMSCRIYTNELHSEWCGFSFNKETQAIWKNGGECATLKNRDGIVVHTLCYP